MARSAQAEPLTPPERIELREALQDRWRAQRRLITLLSLHRDVAEREAGSPDPWIDASAAERAIHRARVRLASIERAMRRLDDGAYGWCGSCGSAIDVARLIHAPEEGQCDGCRAG
jgi:RNA polymerase-binding transcription factor DksA